MKREKRGSAPVADDVAESMGQTTRAAKKLKGEPIDRSAMEHQTPKGKHGRAA